MDALNNKRQRADPSDDDDDVVVTKVVVAKQKPVTRLRKVYLVFKCDYPLQNDKWGEHSGHETQDTELMGVYANLKDANQQAKYEALDDDDDDSDDDESEETLFYWEEEEPCEWTARRVWVEVKQIQY